jgi:hypothetical protein
MLTPQEVRLRFAFKTKFVKRGKSQTQNTPQIKN